MSQQRQSILLASARTARRPSILVATESDVHQAGHNLLVPVKSSLLSKEVRGLKNREDTAREGCRPKREERYYKPKTKISDEPQQRRECLLSPRPCAPFPFHPLKHCVRRDGEFGKGRIVAPSRKLSADAGTLKIVAKKKVKVRTALCCITRRTTTQLRRRSATSEKFDIY
jgi:hypothetical protein